MATEIIYIDPGSPGYQPVFHMARLAAELFEAELVVLRPRSPTPVEKVTALIPRSKRGSAGILICPAPFYLAAILLIKDWRARYGQLVAWVFDSFWPDYIPRIVRLGRIFDFVFVAENEDLETWRRLLGVPVYWLPWGSDALRLGSASPVRPVDLLRFGRQPSTWDDDLSTATACAAVNLQFQGRPPFPTDMSEGERALMNKLVLAKFTLSFSNLLSPGLHTHPQKDYITGRWTDALAAGAIVAGIPPRSESVKTLLWEGALLHLGTVDRNAGLEAIIAAVRNWTPDRAAINHFRSLEILDWRWRFEKIANLLDINSLTLRSELSNLRRVIADRSM